MKYLANDLKRLDEEEVKDLKETLTEFRGYHKKHLFDEDQRIALGYEESIRFINEKIKEINSRWTG